MKKSHWFAIAVSLLSSTLYTSAFAFNRAHAMTFTLGGGYYRFAPSRHINNTGIPYGALAYDLTDRWGVEGLLGFFTTKSRRPEDNGRQVRGTLFALDAIYHFKPYKKMEPFILAGPGATDMNPNGSDANAEGNINAGVGANIFFSKSVALRLEGRDFYTLVGAKNDLYFDGGVSFLFDM